MIVKKMKICAIEAAVKADEITADEIIETFAMKVRACLSD